MKIKGKKITNALIGTKILLTANGAGNFGLHAIGKEWEIVEVDSSGDDDLYIALEEGSTEGGSCPYWVDLTQGDDFEWVKEGLPKLYKVKVGKRLTEYCLNNKVLATRRARNKTVKVGSNTIYPSQLLPLAQALIDLHEEIKEKEILDGS